MLCSVADVIEGPAPNPLATSSSSKDHGLTSSGTRKRSASYSPTDGALTTSGAKLRGASYSPLDAALMSSGANYSPMDHAPPSSGATPQGASYSPIDGALTSSGASYFPMDHAPPSSGATSRGASYSPAESCSTTSSSLAITNPREEDRRGVIKVLILSNHPDTPLSATNRMLLMQAIHVIKHQLPEMESNYISRIVFDAAHRTLVLVKAGKVIGAAAFRVFPTQRFTELVFMVVDGGQQVKGYGSHVMNHLKAYHVNNRILHILTYADNGAKGYFKKQGFQQKIALPPKRYKGFIKDYESATLMECKLNPSIDYLNVPNLLAAQRRVLHEGRQRYVLSMLSKLSAHQANRKPGEPETPPEIQQQIQLMKEMQNSKVEAAQQRPSADEFGDWLGMCKSVHKQLWEHGKAWPFKTAVPKSSAPDYYDIIKQPMDLSKIKAKLSRKRYKTQAMFVADVKRIFINCRKYNAPETVFCRCADELEHYFDDVYNVAIRRLIGSSPTSS